MAASGQPGLRGEGQARRPGLRRGPGRAAAALTDRAVEQAPGQRGGHERADGPPACRLPGDRDPVRVPPEPGDVALHPAQRRLLVQQAVVAVCRERCGAQARHIQEAEHAQPVVDGHHDDVVGLHDQRAVMLVTGPVEQAAAVDHEQHRQPAAARMARGSAARAAGRGEDVKEQAVLGVFPGAVAAGQLRAAVAVGRRAADPGPGPHRLRRLPAQRPHGRGGVGDAQELVHALSMAAPQRAVRGRDDQPAAARSGPGGHAGLRHGGRGGQQGRQRDGRGQPGQRR